MCLCMANYGLVCTVYPIHDLAYSGAGEMVVGPKNTLFLDEISTGLDSSTTFLIVRCVRNFVHTLQVRPCARALESCLTSACSW